MTDQQDKHTHTHNARSGGTDTHSGMNTGERPVFYFILFIYFYFFFSYLFIHLFWPYRPVPVTKCYEDK